tara:strand:- start:2395 stop:2559 length:165 start_codon:yes stop_codon:yes gene_type:complete
MNLDSQNPLVINAIEIKMYNKKEMNKKRTFTLGRHDKNLYSHFQPDENEEIVRR